MPTTEITLKIDGEADAFATWLTSVTYSASMDELDALTVELTLDSPAQLKDAVKVVRAGAPYALTVGGLDHSGDLVRVSMIAGSGGSCRIIATGLETAHRLRHQRLAEVLELSKDKIAAQIIQKAGLTAKTQSVSATAAETVLLDDPMLLTLKKLADERNFSLRCSDKTLEFSPRSAAAAGAALTLSWGVDVFGFELAHDLSEVLTSVQVYGRDYRKGVDVVDYTAKDTDLRKISGGTDAVALRKKVAANAVILNETIRCAAASEVKERAVAAIQGAAETFATGALRCALQPKLKVGQKLSVEGLPSPMTGPFLVHSFTHTLLPPNAQASQIEVFSDGLPSS